MWTCNIDSLSFLPAISLPFVAFVYPGVSDDQSSSCNCIARRLKKVRYTPHVSTPFLLIMQAITDKMVFAFPDFMASPDKKKNDQRSRPRPLHSKSLTRDEPEPATRVSRASTIHNVVASKSAMADRKNVAGENAKAKRQADVFEKTSEDEGNETADEGNGKLPDDFDELPIELVSLSDR